MQTEIHAHRAITALTEAIAALYEARENARRQAAKELFDDLHRRATANGIILSEQHIDEMHGVALREAESMVSGGNGQLDIDYLKSCRAMAHWAFFENKEAVVQLDQTDFAMLADYLKG
jgi:hypothetical protein